MSGGFRQRLRRAVHAFFEEPAAGLGAPGPVSGGEPPVADAPPAPEPAAAEPPAPEPRVPEPPSPLGLGLRDRVLEGWFGKESGELVTGVPILPEHTVLDVGCGEGGLTRFCAQRGARVVFVDIIEAKLNALAELLRASPARSVEPHLSDCNPLPLPDDEADVVICTEMLEHVDDPAQVLKELVRVGKPGARYVITVPDPASEKLIEATGADFYFRKPNHIRVFSREDFRAVVAQSGLVVERHDFTGAYWALFLPLSFLVGQELRPPWHPMLAHWASAWAMLLDHPKGLAFKRALDSVVPRTQVIVARKAEAGP